ncbi:MAG: chromosomal replication initiator protein DnaA [Treponema sp.]|nr:chromosomal replication initiator protein DnaA [Treponema sp.]
MANQIYKEAWNYCMDELHKKYIADNDEDEFVMWFNMKYVEDTIDSITVSVASPFMQNMIQTKGYFDVVQKKICEITGQNNIKIKPIVVAEQIYSPDEDDGDEFDDSDEGDEENFDEFSNDNDFGGKILDSKDRLFLDIQKNMKNSEEKKAKKKHPLLQEEFTFETFIPGDNSVFAYNASLAIAKKPGEQYNPILLYGDSGLGKTHLMQAIGNYIYNNGGEKLKICYTSAESFTNEFILSTKEGTTKEFKNKYRNLDVLLLDDIHFLQNKDATQEELFYTFNALHEKHAQMVFTCDRPIKEIKTLTSRLVSRLANGLCIDIKVPNYETRCAILQKKAEQIGVHVDEKVINYIAGNVETNVRELEAALKQVLAYAELIEQEPTLELAKDQLKGILSSNSNQFISLDIIKKVIADNYQISVSDLTGKKRDKKFTIPRQIAIYIAREISEYTYPELAYQFNKKDHTTIMHAYNNISQQIKIDPNLQSKINIFIREIKEYKAK